MHGEQTSAAVRQAPVADSVPKQAEQETGSLARELAGAYNHMAAFYRDQLQLAGPEADAKARGLDYTPGQAAEDLARIMERPADQVGWFDLNWLVERNPEEMVAVWSHIKEEARRELASGHRTAQALDWAGRPWDRARFLAIRDSFCAEYQPRTGIEAALVDLAAEAYGDYLSWSESLHRQAGTEVDIERHDLARHGKWKPQRIGSAEAMAESTWMAERAHARFLRTIAALGERRRTGPVDVGQVNVAPQQVNIARLAIDDDV